MDFTLHAVTRTIVDQATLELDGDQVEALAKAWPAFVDICNAASRDPAICLRLDTLKPVAILLKEIAGLYKNGHGPQPLLLVDPSEPEAPHGDPGDDPGDPEKQDAGGQKEEDMPAGPGAPFFPLPALVEGSQPTARLDDPAWLQTMHHHHDVSAADIARLCGSTFSIVRTRLKRHGIEYVSHRGRAGLTFIVPEKQIDDPSSIEL